MKNLNNLKNGYRFFLKKEYEDEYIYAIPSNQIFDTNIEEEIAGKYIPLEEDSIFVAQPQNSYGNTWFVRGDVIFLTDESGNNLLPKGIDIEDEDDYDRYCKKYKLNRLELAKKWDLPVENPTDDWDSHLTFFYFDGSNHRYIVLDREQCYEELEFEEVEKYLNERPDTELETF